MAPDDLLPVIGQSTDHGFEQRALADPGNADHRRHATIQGNACQPGDFVLSAGER
jgi:hypothetical protein